MPLDNSGMPESGLKGMQCSVTAARSSRAAPGILPTPKSPPAPSLPTPAAAQLWQFETDRLPTDRCCSETTPWSLFSLQQAQLLHCDCVHLGLVWDATDWEWETKYIKDHISKEPQGKNCKKRVGISQ